MAVQSFKVKVIEKNNLVGKFWSVKLERPVGFEYVAGEYVSVKVNADGQRRSYSLGSSPKDNFLELIFDVKPGGLGSNYLANLQLGEEVEILGPMGRFVVEGELGLERKMLFIGTGSGIVPLRSMIHDLLETRGFGGEVKLHWGMRSDEEIFMVSELEELKQRFANFSYDIVMSQASGQWGNCRGHVQDCLNLHMSDYNGWEAYLCGNQKMVLDVAVLLQTKGVMREKVYFEKYY